MHNSPTPGLGHDYETVLAVSPLQKLLTYYRGEAVLTSVPQWGWRLMEDWLVPLAEGLGYKARSVCCAWLDWLGGLVVRCEIRGV